MKKKATILVVLVAAAGCARFRTVQTDTTTDANGVTRTIVTRASATTFAASKQALANWKASQTDKTQGASVGSVSQETDASKLTEAVGAAIIKGLVAGVKP